MSRYLLYLDESDKGNTIGLAGHIIHVANVRKSICQLGKLKIDKGLSEYNPIKFTPDSKGDKYKAQRAIRSQNEFKKEILSFISKQDVILIGGFIEKNGNLSFERMMLQLLNDIATRFQFELQSRGSTGKIVMAIPSEKKSIKYSGWFHDILQHAAKLHGIMDSEPRDVSLDRIDQGIHFGYEMFDPSLQIADFIVGACLHGIKTGKKEFFNIIRNKFRCVRGYVKGAGLVVYPSNSRIVDTLLLET